MNTILDLPDRPVSDRVSLVRPVGANETVVAAQLDGPGCIRHMMMTLKHPKHMVMGNRKLAIRIYFDGASVPQVEAPIGDFFGVMHGLDFYPINTRYLSVMAVNGYNCYFPMPFAKEARVEIEAGPEDGHFYLQLDWQRYPGQEMTEERRFCARWRREMPTDRYGEDFLMLDADGPGSLLGFVYGVRLLDDADRWSHGGGDNIYIDGEGSYPAFIRGVGGEDVFGVSYGGALHVPETHWHAAIPYYVHEDVSAARPAQRLVGYRFFDEDPICFEESLHLRFGSMRNDICATTYWYQQGDLRPFCELPPWEQIMPGTELPRGTCDLPLPESGHWWLCGPFGQPAKAMANDLPAELEFEPDKSYDGGHEGDSPWLTDGSRELGRDVARWVRRPAVHGFIDCKHAFKPWAFGAGKFHDGVALARCVLTAPAAMTARVRLAWDDHLVLRLNGGKPMDLGRHYAFRDHTLELPLEAGANTLVLKLSNERGSNHGGWAFAFLATAPDGSRLLPQANAK